MIRLQFYDTAGECAVELEGTDFRVTGGVIWRHKAPDLIARYTGGAWKHGDRYYPTLCAQGRCRLHFGITRDPLPVSEAIGVFSIMGCVLRANGVAFARYLEESEMWQGLIRPIWWRAMHIVSAPAVPLVVDESGISLFNPWDPSPSHVDPAFDLAAQSAERSPVCGDSGLLET